MDGVDLSPVLFGQGSGPGNEVFYYSRHDLFAVRLGPCKAHFITREAYVLNAEKVQRNPPLLFKVEEDAAKGFNIADQHVEVVEKIRVALKTHQENMKPGPDLLKERGPEHVIQSY
ncbi:MAG: hypothetical protein AAF634_15740 [Bacteroidota bacterium]